MGGCSFAWCVGGMEEGWRRGVFWERRLFIFFCEEEGFFFLPSFLPSVTHTSEAQRSAHCVTVSLSSCSAVSQVSVAPAATKRGICIPQRTRSCACCLANQLLPLTSEPRIMAASFSQDPLFEAVLCQLPEVLGTGLRAAGMADPAILESYPRDFYKELVDAGVTEDGTRRYNGVGSTDTITGSMDAGRPITKVPAYLFFSYLSSFVSLRSSLLPLSPPASATHKSRSVIYPVVDCSSEGNTVCALETELESKDRPAGGSNKIRRVTKVRSGSKARKGARTPKVEHVGDELGELESLEQVAHVGIASSSKLDTVGELIQNIRFDTSEISEKCEVGLNPRFLRIFAEDPPAERLNSGFPLVGAAPGSAQGKDRQGQSESECRDGFSPCSAGHSPVVLDTCQRRSPPERI